MNTKVVFAGLTIFLILGALIGANYLFQGYRSAPQTNDTSTLDLNKFVQKDLSIDLVDKGKISVPLLKDRPIMINFWASWCGPCMMEMPSIYGLREKYKDQGFEVIAINLDRDVLLGVRALVKRFGEPRFLIIPGHKTKYPELFGLEGVPFTVLVDRRGNIRYARIGERNWLDKDSIRLVEGIL